eukprot:TRINITY_DN2385_c0_g1_i1.p1 TRINITY_DN2385_c0_g1~~TRINITY_DN2385_c0_g1_i1.p1  ORF type:complete len:170 (-),score=42.27 TRINITY_DN2385_c0_g1_i1:45-554(-)
MATLLRGLAGFVREMQSLPAPLQLWAAMFPFPQLLVGAYLIVTRGVGTPAGYLFAARAASFLIAGQVHLRTPRSKVTGPIMHTPFLVAMPPCVRWLGSAAAAGDPGMARFLWYTLPLTGLSLVGDAALAWRWWRHGRRAVGRYPSAPRSWVRIVLPVPSLLLCTYMELL